MPCVDLQMGWEISERIKFVESARKLAIADATGDKAEVNVPVVGSISVEQFEMERSRCLAVDFDRCRSHTDLKYLEDSRQSYKSIAGSGECL
jgi:hypothetical protein